AGVAEQHAETFAKSLAGGGHGNGADSEHRKGNAERRHQYLPIDGKYGRANQPPWLVILAGHVQRIAELLQQLHLLIFAEWAAESRLLLLNLREDAVAQLPNDVVALRFGQRELYGLQITLNQIHTCSLRVVRFSSFPMRARKESPPMRCSCFSTRRPIA